MLLVLAAISFVGGCDSGYDNRSIVEELPSLQQALPLRVEHRSSCRGDSCPFGDDRSSALVTYEVDTGYVTQREVADELVRGLPAWSATIAEICSHADPSFCEPHSRGPSRSA